MGDSINRRIDKLDDHFGEQGCDACRRWRETKVFIGPAAAVPVTPPAPARCPSCGRSVPKMTHTINIIAPSDDEEAGVAT